MSKFLHNIGLIWIEEGNINSKGIPPYEQSLDA